VSDDRVGDIEVAELTYEEMGVALDLPTGWTLEADEDGHALACIAEGVYEDDHLAASITVERRTPLTDDEEELPVLAAASLDEMRDAYRDFALLDDELEGTRAIRVYEFVPEALGVRVRQVQGLVADVGFFVINATAPLDHADRLQPLFQHVIRSLRHVEV